MGHDLPSDHPRRPRLCQLSRGRRRRGASPRSSTRAWTSTSTCAWPATWARASSTCSRPTTTPTTSPATGAWPPPPARPSTSTARRRPSTTTSPSTTAGSSRSARSWCARCTPPATGPSTPPSRSIDTERGPEPWAVLTGDSLFVGGIARPDLAVDPREGAHGIFHSLHDRLLDAARHLRGVARAPRRLDVRRPRDRPQGLLDHRLRARPPGRAAASSTRTSSSSARSPGSARSRRTSAPSSPSTRGPLTRGAGAGRSAHAAPGRAAPARRRACVVDVRTELQFDDAHIPGAICITVLRAGFGSRLAWLADHEQPVVVVGRDDDDARARDRAGRLGRRRPTSPATSPAA